MLGLLLAACGGGTDVTAPAGGGEPATDETAPATAPGTVPAPATAGPRAPGAPAAVPALLDFTAPAVNGGQVVGAELVGRPLALWFWAPW